MDQLHYHLVNQISDPSLNQTIVIQICLLYQVSIQELPIKEGDHFYSILRPELKKRKESMKKLNVTSVNTYINKGQGLGIFEKLVWDHPFKMRHSLGERGQKFAKFADR